MNGELNRNHTCISVSLQHSANRQTFRLGHWCRIGRRFIKSGQDNCGQSFRGRKCKCVATPIGYSGVEAASELKTGMDCGQVDSAFRHSTVRGTAGRTCENRRQISAWSNFQVVYEALDCNQELLDKRSFSGEFQDFQTDGLRTNVYRCPAQWTVAKGPSDLADGLVVFA